jgi:hypothetical protein
MEVYILDSLLRRSSVIDKFESLVWTERWHAFGDFKLEIKSTLENRTLLLKGVKLGVAESDRVMIITSVEDTTDDDGRDILTISGESLEVVLEDRVAKENLDDLTINPKWVITDAPAEIVRTMFNHICRAPGSLSAYDEIPFLMAGSLYSVGTIPESTTPIKWEQDPESLYTAIQKLCELYDLGFRLVKNYDNSELYFDVYAGNDRTTKQTTLPPVIFSVGLDSIQDVTEFSSIRNSKNVAYVFSDYGSVIVYGDQVDSDISGFERRVIVVKPSIDEDDPDINGSLIQAGNEALLENRAFSLFEGEINQYTQYNYGVDYDLGDLVELRNKDGVITYKRVSEQIFVSDANGVRSYPTLALDTFAGANTWLSWNNDTTTWDELTTEYWDES